MKRGSERVVPFRRSPDYYARRSSSSLSDGRADEALVFILKALEADPGNRSYRIRKGEILGRLGALHEGGRELAGLLAEDEEDPEVRCAFAENRILLGDHRAALACVFGCPVTGEGTPYAARFGRVREQAADLERGPVTESRRNDRVLDAVSRCERLLANGERAVARTLAARLPQIPLAVAESARIAGKAGEEETARALLEKIPVSDTEFVLTYCIAAETAGSLGRQADADRWIAWADRCANTGEELECLIRLCFRMGRNEAGLSAAKRRLLQEPSDRIALHLTALMTLRSGGDPEKALLCWQKILSADPFDPVAGWYEALPPDLLKQRNDLTDSYDLPREIQRSYAERLGQLRLLPNVQLLSLWKDDRTFRRVILWAIDHGARDVPWQAAKLLARIKTEDSVRILREFLIRSEPDAGKKAELLSAIFAGGIPAEKLLIRGMLFYPNESALDPVLGGTTVGHRQLIVYASELVADRTGLDAWEDLKRFWSGHRLERVNDPEPLRDTEALASVLSALWIAASEGTPVDLSGYRASRRKMMYYLKQLASSEGGIMG